LLFLEVRESISWTRLSSGTIGIDRSIFLKLIENAINARQWKNTVSCCDHQCERPMQQLPAPRPSELHRPAPHWARGSEGLISFGQPILPTRFFRGFAKADLHRVRPMEKRLL
jgi:hypothetical protein